MKQIADTRKDVGPHCDRPITHRNRRRLDVRPSLEESCIDDNGPTDFFSYRNQRKKERAEGLGSSSSSNQENGAFSVWRPVLKVRRVGATPPSSQEEEEEKEDEEAGWQLGQSRRAFADMAKGCGEERNRSRKPLTPVRSPNAEEMEQFLQEMQIR